MSKALDVILPEGLAGLCTTIFLLACWLGSATGIYAIVSSIQRGLPLEGALLPLTIVMSILPALQTLGWSIGIAIALVGCLSKARNPHS